MRKRLRCGCVHVQSWWSTHIFHSVPLRYVDLEDAVEYLQNLPVEDDCLVEVVAHTCLNQCLQNEVHKFHCLHIDVMVEALDEECHVPNKVDGVDVVPLLPEVVLHEPILPITHQAQHLQGQLHVGGVLKREELHQCCIQVFDVLSGIQ